MSTTNNNKQGKIVRVSPGATVQAGGSRAAVTSRTVSPRSSGTEPSRALAPPVTTTTDGDLDASLELSSSVATPRVVDDDAVPKSTGGDRRRGYDAKMPVPAVPSPSGGSSPRRRPSMLGSLTEDMAAEALEGPPPATSEATSQQPPGLLTLTSKGFTTTGRVPPTAHLDKGAEHGMAAGPSGAGGESVNRTRQVNGSGNTVRFAELSDDSPAAGSGAHRTLRTLRPDVRIDIGELEQGAGQGGEATTFFGPLKSVVQEVLTPPAGKTTLVGSPQQRIEEEGLGDAWMHGAWRQPSEDKAREQRRKAVFQDGRAPYFATGPEAMASMGTGVCLYFHFLRGMCVFFLLASLLHVPHVLLCYYGNRLGVYRIGTTHMGAFTAANHLIRYPYATNATLWCDSGVVDTIFAPDVPCTEPVIQLFANLQPTGARPIYVRGTDASYVVTACDMAACVTWLILWLLLRRKLRLIQQRGPMTAVSTKDYGVEVWGLPRDAKEAEVADHFSRLYPINGGEDWTYEGSCFGLWGVKKTKRVPIRIVDMAGRRIGPELQPVQDVLPFHRSSTYKATWVAEVAIVHPSGRLIRRFRALENLCEQMLYYRAVAKMYNTNTTYKNGKGANRVRFERAKRRLNYTMEKIDHAKEKLKALGSELVRIEMECVSAFVVFEHRKSWERCLKDYLLYSNHALFFRPPPPLLFRGQFRLRVQPAPEPSNVLWENIEVPLLQHYFRRLVTTLFTLLLLVATLLVVVYLQIFSRYYTERENGAVCDAFGARQGASPHDPFVYYGKSNPFCGDPGAYYVSYLFPGDADFSSPCTNPCINPSLPAYQSVSKCRGLSYAPIDVVGCFCMNVVGRELSRVGPWGAYEKVKDQYFELCKGPAYNFVISQSLGLAASLVTILVNGIIHLILDRLTTFERHRSVSRASLTGFLKSFAALFINTVLLLFIVNAYIRNEILQRLGLFMGRSGDFDVSWYLGVGIALCNTMLINTVSPHLPYIVFQMITGPLYRWHRSFYGYVSQHHLNKLYAPGTFILHNRLSSVMNTITVSLFFCAALPLLLPFCFFSVLLTYLLDKLLLLRYCRKPPAYDSTLLAFAIHAMPYLLVIHLFISIWTFGNPDIFASNSLGSGKKGVVEQPYSQLEAASDSYNSNVMPRLFRYNTLPLVVLLIVLVALKIVTLIGLDVIGGFFRWLFTKLVRPCKRLARCLACQDKPKQIPDKVCNFPPFTRAFEVYYPSISEVPELPSESGWSIERVEGKRDSRVVRLVKHWTQDCVADGLKAKRGDRKKTWEVIRDSTLHTYRIAENPMYSDAMLVRSMLNIRAQNVGVDKRADKGDAGDNVIQVMPLA